LRLENGKKKKNYILWASPSTSSRTGRRSSNGTVDVGAHGALTEMGRDVGSAAVGRVRTSRRMLGFGKGQISHLQAVGHDCGNFETVSDK
jgi:hypothetical protein